MATEVTHDAKLSNLEVTGATQLGEVISKRKVIRQTTYPGWNDAALTLTTSLSGALILLDKDEATTLTLPAVTSSDIGTTYEIVETAASDNLRQIVTAFNNDYFVGGVTNSFDDAKTDGVTGGVAFISTGGTDTTIKFDDNLANSGGARVVLTAILTGNTEADGGAKLVWAVSGNKIAQAENDSGAAFFA